MPKTSVDVSWFWFCPIIIYNIILRQMGMSQDPATLSYTPQQMVIGCSPPKNEAGKGFWHIPTPCFFSHLRPWPRRAEGIAGHLTKWPKKQKIFQCFVTIRNHIPVEKANTAPIWSGFFPKSGPRKSVEFSVSDLFARTAILSCAKAAPEAPQRLGGCLNRTMSKRWFGEWYHLQDVDWTSAWRALIENDQHLRVSIISSWWSQQLESESTGIHSW